MMEQIYQAVIKVGEFAFTIFRDGEGFFAQCNELPHCIAQGKTKKELWKNIRNALELCGHEEN